MVRTLIAALAVAAAPAAADTLYEEKGVSLEGSVRMVARGAATCQVLADSETPEAYEATKANHGRPLHVWRVDYGVFNGSGQSLSDLTAHFGIEAEWPPCTNWTGLGQYPGPVQWAGSFETIQRTGGLKVGGEARETLYVLAIDGQQPRFRNWQLNFRFRETTADSEPAAVVVEPEPPPVPFPPEPGCEDVEFLDSCWRELDNQRGCYVWAYAVSNHKWTWDGKCVSGLATGPGTLRTTWPWSTGGTGWHGETGVLRDGRQHGRSVGRGDQGSSEGEYVDGKRQGRWIERYEAAADEDGHFVEEGDYVDDKRHGRWVLRWKAGGGSEGEYLRGERHGRWVTRYPDGRVSTARYVHGEYQD